MEQKIIWMHYLQRGLLISIFGIFLNSCAKVEYAQHADFYFINKTPYQISYVKGYEKFNVAANSTILIKDTQDAVKKVDPTTYYAPFRGISLPSTIKFNQVKCLTIDAVSEHSPIEIKNYIAERIGERTFKFTYTFTEADYNQAVACP